MNRILKYRRQLLSFFISLITTVCVSQNLSQEEYNSLWNDLKSDLQLNTKTLEATYNWTPDDFKKWLPLVEQLLEYENFNGIENNQLYFRFILSSIYHNLKLYKKIIPNDEWLLNKTRILNHKHSVAIAESQYNAYNALADYRGMLNVLQRLVSLKKKYLYQENTGEYLYWRTRGTLQFKLKDFEKALSDFKKSLALYNNESGQIINAGLRYDIALCFTKLKNKDSTYWYANSAKEKLLVNGNCKSSYDCYILDLLNSVPAPFLIEENKFEEAKRAVLPTLNRAIDYNDNYNIIKSYSLLAKAEYGLNNYNASLDFLEKTKPFTKIYFNAEQVNTIQLLNAKNLLSKGEKLKAEVIFNQAKKFRDSIEKSNEAKEVFRAGLAMDIQNIKQEKKLVENTNALNKKRILNLKIGAIVLSLLLIILSIVIYLLIINRRRLKKSRLRAIESLKEKQILLKELHHRVKNNLQVISSMLHLQKRKITDKKDKLVFEASQNHINAMSMVHQILHSEDNFTVLDMNNYITTLCNSLQSSFSSKAIAFKVNNEKEILLSADQATALGLILNELITNSYKHVPSDDIFIEINLTKDFNTIVFLYKDSGKGFDFQDKLLKNKTLGVRLMQLLSEEMNAQLTYNQKNNSFKILIPNE